MSISKSAIIYPNVKLGQNCIVEDFAIIGAVPRGYEAGDLETVIGDNAVIRSHTVIYAGNRIGDNFQTGNKTNIRELNVIGKGVSIGTLSIVEHHVSIGDGVSIHSQAFIPEYTILEDGCWIGPNVVITNARYPKSRNVKETLKGAHIKQQAMVGANSTLLPGVVLGMGSLVGAGSVVTRDVGEKNVVAGNPAKVINSIDNLPYTF
ncbi:MAG TPA: DapH/DapD/GlmU-related protein [Syntrophorhabdaceae bacterium]|jgi:acetyltransferase-like isoleucine patch superfamily enzyme